MTPRQFFNLVVKMREAQNKYFRTRSNKVLNEAREIERQVDAEIERVNNIINHRPTEGELFNQPQ